MRVRNGWKRKMDGKMENKDRVDRGEEEIKKKDR